MRNNTWTQKTVFIFILMILTTCNAGASLMEEEQLTGNKAIIVRKFTNCIVIKNHTLELPSDYIMITSSSSIRDINGNSISLNSLKLPCAASIQYYLKSKTHDAELIDLKVLEYAEKTSAKFKSKVPFSRGE